MALKYDRLRFRLITVSTNCIWQKNMKKDLFSFKWWGYTESNRCASQTIACASRPSKMQTHQTTQARIAALTTTQICKLHLNTHTHARTHARTHTHTPDWEPHKSPPHTTTSTTQCKLQMCSCTCVHISKCLFGRGKTTTSASCSRRWQHFAFQFSQGRFNSLFHFVKHKLSCSLCTDMHSVPPS